MRPVPPPAAAFYGGVGGERGGGAGGRRDESCRDGDLASYHAAACIQAYGTVRGGPGARGAHLQVSACGGPRQPPRHPVPARGSMAGRVSAASSGFWAGR